MIRKIPLKFLFAEISRQLISMEIVLREASTELISPRLDASRRAKFEFIKLCL